jgi:hypothetical protein
MLVLKCSTEIAILEPSVDAGLVTWLEITVHDAESELAPVGRARVAVIHGGEALNYGESIHDVLDADGQELADLDDVFFDKDGLKEKYENGMGSDLLYFADLELAAGWQNRMIEQAAARRITEVFGGGCSIAIMTVADLMEAERWEKVGFSMMALAPTASRVGYVAMDLSMKQPRIVERERDSFGVEPPSNED